MAATESSSSVGDDESPFFADMTLDLAEAHDIAETPEPTKRAILDPSAMANRNIPHMPSIPDNDNFAATSVPPSLSQKTTADEAAAETSPSVPTREMESENNNNINGSFEVGNLTSITSDQDNGGGSFEGQNGLGKRPSIMNTPSSKKYPKDIPWAVGFCIVVPLSLLLPMAFATPSSDKLWVATATAPRLATLHSILWGFVASLVLLRLLYRTMGGGDGDDARHVASQILLASAPISVSVYISLILTLYFMTPHAIHYAIIPMWYLARDLYLFRQWKMTATTPGGRQAFFQALTCMTLDILSRSLRRSSFYRIMSLIVVIQFVAIAWWRLALLAALRSKSFVWIMIALIGGKWATGTIARLLSFMASGGIISWFAEQNTLVQELNDSCGQDEMIEFTPLTATEDVEERNNGGGSSFDSFGDKNFDDEDDMPEAYRVTSASAYKSAITPDEGMDDDFDDEYDGSGGIQPRSLFGSSTTSGAGGSTAKQLLLAGLTVSFVSVAKCGLLGGMAQFIWSQLRKIDTARATFGELQVMSIGSSSATNNEEEGNENLTRQYLLVANVWARSFVRCHSDMAMSHVAAFQKTYQRAALDVAGLIDESGTYIYKSTMIRVLRCGMIVLRISTAMDLLGIVIFFHATFEQE